MKAVRKNLLDLRYNTYLQSCNTCIILLFTFFIGMMLALLTRQIDLRNSVEVIVVADISLFLIILIVMILLFLKRRMGVIIEEIKTL